MRRRAVSCASVTPCDNGRRKMRGPGQGAVSGCRCRSEASGPPCSSRRNVTVLPSTRTRCVVPGARSGSSSSDAGEYSRVCPSSVRKATVADSGRTDLFSPSWGARYGVALLGARVGPARGYVAAGELFPASPDPFRDLERGPRRVARLGAIVRHDAGPSLGAGPRDLAGASFVAELGIAGLAAAAAIVAAGLAATGTDLARAGKSVLAVGAFLAAGARRATANALARPRCRGAVPSAADPLGVRLDPVAVRNLDVVLDSLLVIEDLVFVVDVLAGGLQLAGACGYVAGKSLVCA